MTVSTSSTRELDINRICLRAANMAGLLSANAPTTGVEWEKYSAQARDFLEVEVDSIQAESTLARAVAFYDVVMIPGTATYALPDTTLSVIGDAKYVPVDANAGETLVTAMDRERYQLLSDRATEGTPTHYFAQVAGVVTLFMWPVPSEAGTVRIQRQRLLADNDVGTNTVDLERYWVKYLLFAVAHWLAVSNSIDASKCSYLRKLGEEALTSAKSRSAEPTPGQIESIHYSNWHNR